MKLSELEPSLLTIKEDRSLYPLAANLAEAKGIMFLCPKCFSAHSGKAGTHSIICWFAGRGVPDDLSPLPGRWNPSGTGTDDLTFVSPGATSVLLQSGCGAHFHIENGEIKMC